MSDDLRLVATVEDKFTGPLAKLRRGISEVSSETKQHVGAWKKDWDGAREGVSKFEGVLRGVAPVLSGLGVAGIGVGLSIGGVASAIGEFSTKTRDLSLMAKSIGMTVNELRTFQALGERFGVTADTMSGAAKSFASQMFELKRHGEAYVQLQAMNLSKLAEDLASAQTMAEAKIRALDGLAKIPDAEVRRRVSRMLFGTDDIALIAENLGKSAKDALKDVNQSIGNLTAEQEKNSKRYVDGINRMSEAWKHYKEQVIGGGIELMFDGIDNGRGGDSQLRYLRKRRSELDGRVEGAPEGSFKRRYFENQRDGVDAEIRKLEEATRKGTALGVEDALRKRDQNGGATVQQQSFGGGGFGGGSLIQKAAWGGMGGLGGGIGRAGLGGEGGAGFGAGTGPLGGREGAVGGRQPAGPGGGLPDVPTPRGNGRGNPRAARTGQMMAWAMDQLRREGVPEANLRQAAAHLVGQATMESGLDPNKVHDGGTGYGIYGARDPKGWGDYRGARRSHMVRWLEANGYARNSAEGQMRYMVREAMGGGYPRTKRILMGQGSGNPEADTNSITGEFERPFRINRRYGAVSNAMRVGPEAGEQLGPTASGERPWHDRPRSNEPGKMSRVRDDEIDVPGGGERAGDRMMRRFYGGGSPAVGGKGSLDITLHGFPAGTKARASMDDLFKDTSVNRSRAQMDMGSS